MLDPGTRVLLSECLRPPEGMKLEAAIGTTFSLQLDALISVSAVFALKDLADAADGADHAPEPVALLDAVRRYSERIAVFCQAGAIQVPARHRPLYAWLEDGVVECTAPRGGAFHPKVWALRFGDAMRTSVRLVCLSRNLTFDTSWDVVARLEASPLLRRKTHPPTENGQRLAAFLRALVQPGVAVRSVGDATHRLVEDMAVAVTQADFQPPPGMRDVHVWPMGFGDEPTPRLGRPNERAMVIAPFINATGLDQILGGRGPNVLVSRAESLDRLGANALKAFEDIYVMSPDAMASDEQEASGLRGLHAKAFVLDGARTTRVIAGSANATIAALTRNVEFVCELAGGTSGMGIEAMLDAKSGDVGLLDLLEPYRPADEPTEAALSEVLSDELDLACQHLASVAWTVRVSGDGDDVHLAVTAPVALPQSSGDLTAVCHPITLPRRDARSIAAGGSVDVEFSCSSASISSFVAVALTLQRDEVEAHKSFVICADLHGAPADRRERILAELLADPRRFVEYLLLLLGQDDVWMGAGDGSGALEGFIGAFEEDLDNPPLLEVLARALSRSPDTLDHVDGLVREMRRTDAGRAALPHGFDELWDVVWSVRQGLVDQ